MRRQALRAFCREGGISRNAAEAHLHKLEHHIRAAADARAPRAMAVLRPLRVVLTNLAAEHCEEVAAKARPSTVLRAVLFDRSMIVHHGCAAPLCALCPPTWRPGTVRRSLQRSALCCVASNYINLLKLVHHGCAAPPAPGAYQLTGGHLE